MDTQCDTDISERQTDPIYEEVNTQCDTDISERQTDPIYEEVNTQCDTDISERQTDPIYEELNTQCDTDISERQTDPIYEEVNTQCDTDISERQTDFHSQPIYQDPHTDSEGLKSTPETMKIQEGEPGVDVLRECPQVKKPFFISMARKLWDRIRPQKETSKLKGPWTDHVYNIFKEKIPSCTLI